MTSSAATAATETAATAPGVGTERDASDVMLATVPLGKDGLPLFKEDEEGEDSDEDDLWDVDGEMTAEQVTAALTEEKRRKKVRGCAVRYKQGQVPTWGGRKTLLSMWWLVQTLHLYHYWLYLLFCRYLPPASCQRAMCIHPHTPRARTGR